MRCQWLVCISTAAALALSAPTPASAQSVWHSQDTRSAALQWEMSYLALSAIDTAQTIDCLQRGRCEEVNPLFGGHPSTKTLLLTKIGVGLAHFALFNHLNDRSPKTALRLAQIGCVVQGGAVLLNARFAFK